MSEQVYIQQLGKTNFISCVMDFLGHHVKMLDAKAPWVWIYWILRQDEIGPQVLQLARLKFSWNRIFHKSLEIKSFMSHLGNILKQIPYFYTEYEVRQCYMHQYRTVN